jgi:MFS superfamily sulfate permease-like transporter
MSLSGLVLGVINAAIVIAILLLVGAIILWFCNWMGIAVPGNVQKGYIAVVALIGLYLLVALLFGIPSVRIIGHGPSPTIGAALPPAPNIMREN